MIGNYPVVELTNGIKAKFMCMNIEGLELYKNLADGKNNLIRDENDCWSVSDGKEWGKRETPLFGVKTKEILRHDVF